MLYLVHMENSNNIGLALKKTIDLMVGTGEAPDRIRAKTLLTIMYGANPTEEQLKSYRHSMHRKGGSTHRTQEKVAALIESAPVGTGDPFEGLV